MGVAVEADILAKFEESDVILLIAGSISRVSEVTLDVDLLFGSFGVAQIVLTSDNFHSGATAAVEGGRRRTKYHSVSYCHLAKNKVVYQESRAVCNIHTQQNRQFGCSEGCCSTYHIYTTE